MLFIYIAEAHCSNRDAALLHCSVVTTKMFFSDNNPSYKSLFFFKTCLSLHVYFLGMSEFWYVEDSASNTVWICYKYKPGYAEKCCLPGFVVSTWASNMARNPANTKDMSNEWMDKQTDRQKDRWGMWVRKRILTISFGGINFQQKRKIFIGSFYFLLKKLINLIN